MRIVPIYSRISWKETKWLTAVQVGWHIYDHLSERYISRSRAGQTEKKYCTSYMYALNWFGAYFQLLIIIFLFIPSPPPPLKKRFCFYLLILYPDFRPICTCTNIFPVSICILNLFCLIYPGCAFLSSVPLMRRRGYFDDLNNLVHRQLGHVHPIPSFLIEGPGILAQIKPLLFWSFREMFLFCVYFHGW